MPPSKNRSRYAVAGIAAVVLAAGGYAIGNSNSGDSAAASDAAQTVAPGQAPKNGQVPRNGRRPPAFGTPVAGAAAKKAKAAALARYTGTAERVEKLQNGSYVVHVITSKGEYHVRVSKAYEVTGADQGRPGAPPPGAKN